MIAPEGTWAAPIGKLQDLLAQSEAWQAWCRASAATAATKARARTHAVYLPPPDSGPDRPYTVDELIALRPLVVVNVFDGPGGLRLRKVAEPRTWTQGGSLAFCFEDNIAETDLPDPARAEIKFMNRVGAVLNDLMDLGGVDGNLNLRSIELMTAVQRTASDDVPTIGDRLIVWGKCDYGV